jgi:methyl-accepting chemotaxis protein
MAARARANAEAHLALLGGGKTDVMGLALRAITALMDRMDQAQRINRQTMQYLEQLESIGGKGGGIQRALVEIDLIVSGLHMLALNGRMEAARAGSHGQAFGEVASQTSEMSQRIRASAGQVRELLTNLVHRGAIGVRKEVQTEEENAKACRAEAGRAMDELGDSYQRMQQAVQESAAGGAALAADLDETITALQFQDAVNQQLEHAASTLVEMGTLLGDFVASMPDPEAIYEAARESGWEEQLRGQYTMQSERQAMDRSVGRATEGHSPAGSIELF